VLSAGLALNAVDLWHPVDGASREIWRESDVAGIARNFAREGMNILYPRIDWRRDGPGYVEMEFPIYPYLIAIGYKIFGYHEEIGRVISYIATFLTLCLFLRLADLLLPPPGALVAGLFFVINPLVGRLATAIQPEPFMLLGYVGAAYAWIRWLSEGQWRWYVFALVCTAFAILAKAPAAHIGIVFLLFAIWRRGWTVFRDPRVWMFAVLALLPPALWYIHARGFWLTYGNSLGVSNHQHFVGLAALVRQQYVIGIGTIELASVWTKPGLLAVVIALLLAPIDAAAGYAMLWYAGVTVYYLVIAGTSAEKWGTYYHIVSVPPAALLVGYAAAVAWTRLRALDARTRSLAAGAFAVILGAAVLVLWAAPDRGRFVLAAITLVGLAAIIAGRLRVGATSPATRQPVAAAAILGAIVVAGTMLLRQTVLEEHPTTWAAKYTSARQFAPLMVPGARIAVSGGYCVTTTESAYELPWYLFLTDHKGYSLCIQDHTMGVVRDLIAHHVDYFIVDVAAQGQRPDFVAAMRRVYPVLAVTSDATLFELHQRGEETRSSVQAPNG